MFSLSLHIAYEFPTHLPDKDHSVGTRLSNAICSYCLSHRVYESQDNNQKQNWVNIATEVTLALVILYELEFIMFNTWFMHFVTCTDSKALFCSQIKISIFRTLFVELSYTIHLLRDT